MVLIVSFCSVFSIRLGSLIVAALSLMQAAVMEGTCIFGLQDIQSVSQTLNELMFEKDLLFLTSFLNSIRKNPEPYLIGTLFVLIVYSFSCILLIYGALKLNVWMAVPFVGLEFARLCLALAGLVAGMLVLKKNSLDLGPLMGGSTGGGLFMLLMLYLWACPLSLVQELWRRRRQERTLAKQKQPGVMAGEGEGAALEAKLWQQTTHIPQYPFISPYPAYRGYPTYIE